jgi:hypothetical protein
MSLNSSADYFIQSERLRNWVEKNSDFLSSLDRDELEQLIFSLKNAQQGVPEEQTIDEFIAFNEKLKTFGMSEEVLSVQKKAFSKLLKAIGVSAVMGLTLSIAIVACIASEWLVGLLLISLCGYLFYKAFKLAEATEILNKEQDRRYLFRSIRFAKTASELTWAGLFAYNSKSRPESGGRTDREIEAEELEVKRLRQELRDSLYRDPSGPFLSANAVTDPDQPS